MKGAPQIKWRFFQSYEEDDNDNLTLNVVDTAFKCVRLKYQRTFESLVHLALAAVYVFIPLGLVSRLVSIVSGDIEVAFLSEANPEKEKWKQECGEEERWNPRLIYLNGFYYMENGKQ